MIGRPTAMAARTEKAIAAVGGPTPEDIIADLDELRRGVAWFRVDPGWPGCRARRR
jgi:hypothetical protein